MTDILSNKSSSVLLAKEENQLSWNEVLEKLGAIPISSYSQKEHLIHDTKYF